ncbi:MAG: hypothetical protein L3J74_07060 [Bacteroidales bacterium]|nr:hypothetical protein [Bacteroidales bacterium]
MKIYILIPVLLFLLYNSVFAQESIKTVAAYKQKVNFEFSSEWQYLSTDLYLLNADKFSYLINQIAMNSSGKKKKRGGNDYIQSIFIQATVKDVKFFGGDVVYPIYSFQIQKDEKYTTQIADNAGVIRLIDNLPLSASKDYIDAEINGDIVTNNNKNKFILLVAKQMQNISRFSQPNTAVFELIGELGKFLESKTTGKQYKFSSTIRLYEDQDFNRRLHSINIFVFIPSSLQKVTVTTGNLSNYINSENPVINQKKLRQLITFRRYPMMIVVNYKSRYESEPVIGDQIDYEYIAERKRKMGNAYKNELINEQTYIFENELIKYLELFVRLKLDINNYSLNKQNKITDDFRKNIFVILQDYRKMLDYKNSKERQYYNNSGFNDEFKEKYENILNTAKIYLAADQDLKNIKEVMNIVYRNSATDNIQADSAMLEHDLKILHLIDFPESEKQSLEARLVQKNIDQSEKILYKTTFVPLINELYALPLDDESYKNQAFYKKIANYTNCVLCRQKLNAAINDYTNRYNNQQKKQVLELNEQEKQSSMDLLFDYVKKKNCIENNVANITEDNKPEFYSLFEAEYDKFKGYLSALSDLVKSDAENMSIENIQEQNETMQTLRKKINKSYENMNIGFSALCKCKE